MSTFPVTRLRRLRRSPALRSLVRETRLSLEDFVMPLFVAPDADQSQIVAGVFLFRGITYAGPIVLGVVSLLIWKLRASWRVPAPPEPVGAAGVGAVIADREPPRPGAGAGPSA